eukprot:UN30957
MYTVMPARFGVPNYNGNHEGLLVRPDNIIPIQKAIDDGDESQASWLGCRAFTAEETRHWPSRPIVLLDRGICYFVDKVKNAVAAGAAAVIIANHEDDHHEAEHLIKMSAPEEDFEHSDILVPVIAMFKSDATEITNYLKQDDSDYTKTMVASIRWNLPRTDGKVDFKLYTSSQDGDDLTFKKEFQR